MNRKSKYEQKYLKKTIRFSPDEYIRIEKELQKNGENFTQFAKRAIMKKKTRLPSYLKAKQKLAYEVNKIGLNINQIAKEMHQTGTTPHLEQLVEIEKALHNLV